MTDPIKRRTAGYWVVTGFLALALTGGGIMDLVAPPDLVEQLSGLGYPTYLATILGVWKLLAVVAILAPGFPRLKEWAYAGVFFDLTGAFVSHLASGDSIVTAAAPMGLLVVSMASWWLRPAHRRV